MRARAPGHDQGGRARRWGTYGRPYAAEPAALAAACPRPPWHAQWGGSPGGGHVGGNCPGMWAGLAGVPGRGSPPPAHGRGSPGCGRGSLGFLGEAYPQWRVGGAHLCDDEEVVPWLPLNDNLLSILKPDGLQGVSHRQALPLLQGL